MSADDETLRKQLTFEQAEGVDPLPAQLGLKEVSPALRARLWAVVHEELSAHSNRPDHSRKVYLTAPWRKILYGMHVHRYHRMADAFDDDFDDMVLEVKPIFEKGDYVAIFGWLQWILRTPGVPYGFVDRVDAALRRGQAAYRVLDRDTIVPMGSDAEKQTLEHAFVDLSKAEFQGARAHLRKAASELTIGHYSDSVRESIHAVESVARTIEPSAELSKALAKLEKSAGVHGALKSAFASMYGYSSDEQGIRHPLLDDAKASVDETDALFMLGSCAAFVSYLIGKGRSAGLLTG